MDVVMRVFFNTGLSEFSCGSYCVWHCTDDENGLVKVACEKFGKPRQDGSKPMGAIDKSQRVTRASTFGALSATASAKMSVLLETSAGDITIDLYVDEAPKACEK